MTEPTPEQLRAALIKQIVAAEASTLDIYPSAVRDLAQLAARTWQVEAIEVEDANDPSGKREAVRLIPMTGEAVLYGDSGIDPATPAEWLDWLRGREDSSFYFTKPDAPREPRELPPPGVLARMSPEELLAYANYEDGRGH